MQADKEKEKYKKQCRTGHVRDILRRRPPIGIAFANPLANVVAAEVEDDDVPLAWLAPVAGAGGFVSMTSWIFRIQVEAIEALPATQQWVFVGYNSKRALISTPSTGRMNPARSTPEPPAQG